MTSLCGSGNFEHFKMILIRENKAAYTATAFLLLILLVPLLAPGQIAPGGIYNGGTLKLWLDKTSNKCRWEYSSNWSGCFQLVR